MITFAAGTSTRALITKFLITGLVSAFIIWRNPKENNRRVFGNWKNYFLLVGLIYMWLTLSLVVHEWGHAFANLLVGNKLVLMELGTGPILAIFSRVGNLKFDIVWRLFPLGGFCKRSGENARIFVLASGVILEFLFSGLVYYWLKSRVKEQKEASLGQVFMVDYLIPVIFWNSLLCNCIPFVLPSSDYTKIAKILLGMKL